MPSIDELNAAFDAVQADITQAADQFAMPFLRGIVLGWLASQRGREAILDGVRKALVAAEQVRAK